MGKPTGFLEIERAERNYEPVEARVKHWHELVVRKAMPVEHRRALGELAKPRDEGAKARVGT